MNKTLLQKISLFVFAFLIMYSPNVQAQNCSGDAPVSYTILSNPANPSECFLQLNWGDAMPELVCGNPGTPAPGSNVPAGRRIDFLQVTVNGTDHVLYARSECINNTNMLQYGGEANTQISFLSEVDFCLAAAERFIMVEGVQVGAADFNCVLANSLVAAPVEFAYFRGASKAQTNILEWGTASEENTAVFVVEKRNGISRQSEMVGSVDAQGFSTSAEYYQLEDRNPQALTYYRVRAIDFDGSEMASQWIAVERGDRKDRESLTLSPIPMNGKAPLQVNYEAFTEESVIMTVSDISGRKLWEERKELEEGVYNWELMFPNFDQQLLIFRMHTRDGVISRLIPVEKGN